MCEWDGATGHARWFERLLAELGFELWIGDPAQIKAKRVRKQKTDREDARLLRKLVLEDRFPRIWLPSPENRDLRQLLWHRRRLVQMRTRIMNQLQSLAIYEGKHWKASCGVDRDEQISSDCRWRHGPTPERVAGAARPDESDDRRVNRCRRARSKETARCNG